MNINQINQEINHWQNIIHDLRGNNRNSFISKVKIGGGDDIYAKECSHQEAILQCRVAIDMLSDDLKRLKYNE